MRKRIYCEPPPTTRLTTSCYQTGYAGKKSEQLGTMMIIDNDKAGTLFITSVELHRARGRKTNKSAVGAG